MKRHGAKAAENSLPRTAVFADQIERKSKIIYLR